MYIFKYLLIVCLYEWIGHAANSPEVTSPSVDPNSVLFPKIRFGNERYRISKKQMSYTAASRVCNDEGLILIKLSNTTKKIIQKLTAFSTISAEKFWTYDSEDNSDTKALDVNGTVSKVDQNTNLFFICQTTQCPVYKYNENLKEVTLDGKKYRISSLDKPQNQASKECEEYGMELISIQNQTKTKIIKELKERYGKQARYWSSGVKKDGKWSWGGKEKLTYKDWKRGEPNSREKNNDCIQILTDGKWNDERCWKKFLYICEMTKPECVQPDNDIGLSANANVGTGGVANI